MNGQHQLREEYAGALAEHMANADEAVLQRAYELGRRILGGGTGVIDLVALHHEAFDQIRADGWPSDTRRDLHRASEFLAESLSPFEMSLRGYREANSRLTALQETLEQKIEKRTRELVIASKVKDDFLAMVSHELRTPLTSIASVIKLLDNEALGLLPPSVRKPVKLAQRNCERLVRIVDDLLDLTKIARGAFDLHLQPAELVPILLQVIESRQIDLDAQKITLSIADGAEDVWVATDPPRLQQVLDNLLTNAAKFSDVKSTIEVDVDRHAACIRVSVTDHGMGIAEEYRDAVFKAFTQADSTATRAKGGVGLGLSIARAIILAHRGTIDFSSVEGEGTTFYFDLPIEDVPQTRLRRSSYMREPVRRAGSEE
jgi:signal transduction histidine kinase